MAIKMSYVMNVINGEPFTYYQLMSIYPHAHEIIIVEGAYERFSHAATPNGHSTDATLDVIANFPDPEQKITLVTKQGFWNDRCEMCNAFMPRVTGDVIWQVDVDEFYYPGVHEHIAKMFSEDEELDRVSFRVRDFFASLRYEVVGAIHVKGLSDVRRVHRFAKGDCWISQRPPTIVDANGNLKPICREITAPEMFEKGIYIFHLTTLFEKQIRDKFKYYYQKWKDSIQKPNRWMNETWYHFRNPLNLSGMSEYASWIDHFSEPLPPELEQMMIDIGNGKYPNIAMRNNFDIEGYLQSRRYHEDVLMGRRLNSFHVNLGKKELLPALEDLLYIFCNFIRSPFRITYRYCMFGALKAFLLAMLAMPRYFV